jgi:hypothetical protein
MNANSATKPRMMPIKNLAKNGPVGVLKPRCTTRLARTFQSTRTRRRREQYMPLVAFCLRHFLADFIICMCEFDFRQAQEVATSRRRSQRMLSLVQLIFRPNRVPPLISSLQIYCCLQKFVRPLIQRPRGAGFEAHQGWTCDKPGSIEIGRSPLDSRAAAAIAGSGNRMGGTAW